MITQPYIIRVYFSAESDALSAVRQFNNAGLFADYVKSDNMDSGKWKVVFQGKNLTESASAVKNLTVKPKVVEVWDPSEIPADSSLRTGYSEFKTLF